MSRQSDTPSMTSAALRESTEQDDGAAPADPVRLLQELLRDPVVQESLHQGRQQWLHNAQQVHAGDSIGMRSARALEHVWQELKSLGSIVNTWLEPLILSPSLSPVRSGEPQTHSPVIPPTFLQPSGSLLSGDAGTLMVWRVAEERLELLRSREVGSSGGQAPRPWIPLRVRDEGQPGPTTLLLVRLSAGHALQAPLSTLRDSALLPEGEVEALLVAVAEASSQGEVAVQWLEVG